MIETLTTSEVIDLERAAGQDFGPFYQHWLRQSSPGGVRRLLRLAAERPWYEATAPRFVQSSGAMTASAAAVANTVTETNLWIPANWTPIAAFDMEAGKKYVVKFGGIMQTTATPTYIFKPYVGGSTTPGSNIALGTGPTITAGTIPASSPFFGELSMVVRSVDVNYTAITATGNGFVVVPAAAAAVHQVTAYGGSVPTTIPNTAASGLVVSITWGTANASNTITCQWADIRWE
jgi:hypothetical protein